jgi:hypothetical protein
VSTNFSHFLHFLDLWDVGFSPSGFRIVEELLLPGEVAGGSIQYLLQ